MPQTLSLLTISGPDAKKLLQGQLTCDVEKLSSGENCPGALCNPQGRIISLFQLFYHHDQYDLLMLKRMVPLTLTALKKYAVFFKVTLMEENAALPVKAETYFDLAQGIPFIYPETSGKFLPHELRLENMAGAISFEKGCYTGQEIIARLHYRGKVKSRLETKTIETAHSPQPGDVTNEGILVDVREKSYNLYEVLVLVDT